MARKGWLEFAQGYGLGQRMVNDYRDSQKKKEIKDVMSQTETPAFTDEQDAERTAKANARDENGNPIYNFSADEQGNISTTLNQQAVPGAAPEAYEPVAVAKRGVSFLGKSYDAPLSDDQRSGAQTTALAGVLAKHGDLEGSMRLKRDAKRESQSDQQFAWSKEKHDTEAADQKTMKEVDGKTADWFKSRLKNPDGTDREATIDDHLAASQYRASALTQAGKVDAAGKVMAEHNTQAHIKIQLEAAQRDQALGKTAAALAAGDMNAVKDFYNKYVPDGAKVVDVARGANGQITISRETLDGKPMPPTVLKDAGQLTAALASFKDPMALYNWSQNEFRNNLALKADARAGAADGRAAASFNEGRNDKKAQVAAGVALYKETNPNATPAQLEAVRTSILAAVPKVDGNAPSEVKLAKAMVDAGMASDMKSGLELALSKKGQSPEDLHQGFVAAGIKNSRPASRAVKMADETMEAMGYTKSGGRWSQGGGAAAKPTGAPAKVSSPEDLAKLPKGTRFTAPDGSIRVK